MQPKYFTEAIQHEGCYPNLQVTWFQFGLEKKALKILKFQKTIVDRVYAPSFSNKEDKNDNMTYMWSASSGNKSSQIFSTTVREISCYAESRMFDLEYHIHVGS